MVTLGTVVGIGYVAYSYLIDMVGKGQSGQVLSQVSGFLSGIAVTLAVQFLWYIGQGKLSND